MLYVSTQVFQILWHLGIQIMDTQLAFFLSFLLFPEQSKFITNRENEDRKECSFISTFCAPPFRGFHDLSALQTSPLYSIGFQLLPLPFLWLYTLPLDFLQGVLLDLTEPYNHREVQMKQIHIYVLWAKYSVSTKFTY